MSVLTSLFLGIVQGIAEFLPISSSGHLSILQNLLKLSYSEEGHLFFDVLLHLGTFISICIVYRRDLRAMFADSIEFLRNRSDGDDDGGALKPSVRMVVFIIVGTLPLIIAYIFSKSVATLFLKTGFIGFALLVTGALLYVSDKLIKPGSKTEKKMTVKDALLIGIAQAIAVIPGLSRSGATISVGLSRGLERDFAVRFSLLLSLPAVLGATIVTIFSAFKAGINWALAPIYLAGFVVATVVGCVAIYLVRGIMAKGKFGNFAYYCWGVGVLTIILSIILN